MHHAETARLCPKSCIAAHRSRNSNIRLLCKLKMRRFLQRNFLCVAWTCFVFCNTGEEQWMFQVHQNACGKTQHDSDYVPPAQQEISGDDVEVSKYVIIDCRPPTCTLICSCSYRDH